MLSEEPDDHKDDDRFERARLPRRRQVMTKAFDGLFDYQGLGGVPSRCHLRVYRHPDRPVIVVASELAENPGTSITNALPDLADAVCATFDIDPDLLLWVENYDANHIVEESFERVWFTDERKPAWAAMTRDRLVALIGESFGPI